MGCQQCKDVPRDLMEVEKDRKALALWDGVTDAEEIDAVVSFPGRYQEDWNELVATSELLKLANSDAAYFSTACVFLPETDPLYGKHVANHVDGDGHCFCYKLYGSPQPWGCAWFDRWIQQLDLVLERGQNPVVVYKQGEVGEGDEAEWEDLPITFSAERRGLGPSQAGEVAFLKQRLGHDSFDKADVERISIQLRQKGIYHMEKVFHGDEGGRLLASSLRNCPPTHRGLRKLRLQNARVGDSAGAQLAEALPLLLELQELHLPNNCLRGSSSAALAAALPRCLKLEDLDLSCNDVARVDLAQAIGECGRLMMLCLNNTSWGSAETQELAVALSGMGRLRVLYLEGNGLPEGAREGLRRAWLAGGREERNLALDD